MALSSISNLNIGGCGVVLGVSYVRLAGVLFKCECVCVCVCVRARAAEGLCEVESCF